MAGNPKKIHGGTIDILEAEGLAPALNAVAAVLKGHGLEKYPVRNWINIHPLAHRGKAIGHLEKPGIDVGGSEQPHAANGVARALFYLAWVLAGYEDSTAEDKGPSDH